MDWLKEAQKKLDRMPVKGKEVRERALADLYFFARLVNPGYVYGLIHKEVYTWMQEYSLFGKGDNLTSNKLILLPRGHLKSHMLATWCAWMIARHPEITILYVSATADLAITQLYAIKNILESDTFRRYFPEYIHPDEGKREKWSNVRIIVDHPRRKEQGIRDATISTAGLTTNTTGWHADVIVSDDLVVPENAYTIEGRETVSKKASQFTSIRNAGGFTMAAGTRYHPKDVYFTWKNQTYEEYNDEGVQINLLPVWEIKEYAVEVDDVFLWPRAIRDDGKAFGFDLRVLARIRAEYIDRVQYYAQYYNDPNDPGSERISRDKFQYFNPHLLKPDRGNWYYNHEKLNVYAAVDFAFSLSDSADYTAIVVIGIDPDFNIYVLDIDRFKTTKTIDYFRHIAQLHNKWKFRKLNAEVSVAQKVIVESIKDYIGKQGMRLAVEEYRPSKAEGSKEERIAAALEPKYDNYQVWHREGGWTDQLEDELVLSRPAHDDIKDAMASAITIAKAPNRSVRKTMKEFFDMSQPKSRFGGF